MFELRGGTEATLGRVPLAFLVGAGIENLPAVGHISDSDGGRMCPRSSPRRIGGIEFVIRRRIFEMLWPKK
jgi:hypothetical protein